MDIIVLITLVVLINVNSIFPFLKPSFFAKVLTISWLFSTLFGGMCYFFYGMQLDEGNCSPNASPFIEFMFGWCVVALLSIPFSLVVKVFYRPKSK